MARLKEALKVLLLANMLLLTLGLTYEAIHLRPALESGVRATNAVIRETSQTLQNLREASASWKDSSKQQALSTTTAMSNVNVAVGRLSDFVSRTDVSVNSILLPRLTSALAAQDAALLSSQEALQANLKEMLLATQQLQKTLADADAVVSDPALKESLQNLEESTKNTSEATAHLSNITLAGEQTAQYYQKKLTTPQSFFKTLLQAVLQLGSQARILFSH